MMEREPDPIQIDRWPPPALPPDLPRSKSDREAPALPPAIAADFSPPLLLTKLTVPRMADASGLLDRPDLIGRILGTDRVRLAVVCAPAGYGKTTLVAQAVSASDRLGAWLSLDERDSDPGRFMAYLVGALRRVHPEIGASLPRDHGRPDEQSSWTVLETILNDIAASEQAITLVLDDYHRVRDPVVHQLMIYLVEFMPPQMRLVLTSRVDPPLPLARLRARGDLLELRAAHLSFSREETARYLAIGRDDRLPPGLIARVHTRTEGWIVALQLLNLLVRAEPDERRTEILNGFVGSRRQVAEFLVDEVLRQQTPARRDFLLRTSILARLIGSLCDAVTGAADGQAMLHSLEHDGMPIFAMDDQRRWYRYHPLLSEYLGEQLADEIGEDEVALLHRRASAWLSEHDQIDEAIDHSLAARDWERAIDLLYRAGLETTAYRRTLTLRRWLEALPGHLRDADPMLCFWHGRTLSSTCQPQRARPLLERAERAWLDSGSNHLLGSVRIARAWGAIHEGRTADALALSLSANELTADDEPFARSTSIYTHAAALLRAGHARVALAQIGRAESVHPLPTIASVEIGWSLALQGRLAEAARKIQYGLTNDNPTDSHRRGHLWLATIFQALNDLDRADQQLERAEELAEFLNAESFFPSVEIARARWLWASGRHERALAAIAQGIETARRVGVEAAVREAEAVRAGLWLALGRYDEAEEWRDRAGFGPDPRPDYANFDAHLVYGRVLIAGGRPDTALSVLARLRLAADDDGRVIDAGRILTIEALAHQEASRPDEALASLTEAIALLEPTGHLRFVADDGRALTGLLRTVAASGAHLDYVRRLLEVAGHHAPSPEDSAGGLVDPLSSRELEVLRLVSVGLSNREISDHLFISVPTVKRHVSTILEKLAANSRTQAVSVARSLQLI